MSILGRNTGFKEDGLGFKGWAMTTLWMVISPGPFAMFFLKGTG